MINDTPKLQANEDATIIEALSVSQYDPCPSVGDLEIMTKNSVFTEFWCTDHGQPWPP